jgi:DNA-binding beta-propeller fold protein YncE
MRNRKIVGGIFVGLLVLLGCTQGLLQQQANQANQGELVNAPAFEVDRPLAQAAAEPLAARHDHRRVGRRAGPCLDHPPQLGDAERERARRRVDPPTGECCRGAPPVLEFDPAGNLLRHWGGPGQGYEWPQSNHGIFVDYKGNVWIGGNGEKDAHILKFTKDGKFLMQVGRLGNNKGSNDLENFGRVAKIFVDPKTNEAFVADGYGNRRVAVLDADTGKMKRYWGAYGNRPQDGPLAPFNPDAPPSQQFRNPVHCSDVSNDGFVYVCDRQGNRLQVFTKDGKFVKEQWYARRSLSEGSVWDVAFSRDPEQRYLFMADGRNQKVRIILRETLEEITNFGDGGRQPGQFFGVHSIATDSKGNLYTTETYEGKRLQKFVYKGMRQVRRTQGVAWPSM